MKNSGFIRFLKVKGSDFKQKMTFQILGPCCFYPTHSHMFLLPIAIVIISLFSVLLVCVVILISGDTCCDAPVKLYFLPCALFRSTTRRSQRA